MITNYTEICAICGRQRECTHHLIFGKGFRKLADEDGLTLPMCNRCHNMGRQIETIHGNIIAEDLSKIIGQLAWEKSEVAKGISEDDARENFRRRYGKSWL